MNRYLSTAATIVISVAAGMLAGWFLANHEYIGSAPPEEIKEIREGGYFLINPLLDCELSPTQTEFRELKPFKYKVNEQVQKLLDSQEATEISVYFRDLNNGPWFGINENAYFSPASLMKVPVMMAYFKLAEEKPAILTTKIKFDGDKDLNSVQYFKPRETLIKGNIYTIDELIYRMIVYSDNNAYEMLVNQIGTDHLDRILSELDINYTPTDYEDLMSVKSYAGFYRVLFNASYLNKALSAQALSYLARSDFKQGVAAGVPENVPVATKFGEWAGHGQGDIKQLHEFGIIYYPGHPYLLGIMTRGHDVSRLTEIIRDISHLIYSEVDQQHAESMKGGSRS